MGDAGAFVALFRFHGTFLSNEGHFFVLFQEDGTAGTAGRPAGAAGRP